MLEAVSDGEVSGVVLKFFKENAKVGYTLSAKDYFDPYHNNLTQILRDKGIHLFNEKIDSYTTDQRVIDDTIDQQSFFAQRHLTRQMRGRPKSYAQIWHDVLLWYFICDKRPPQFDSVIDAEFLGITIDYSLLGFDSFKRRTNISKIPVFIHPATLIQLFQFFVPADEIFEAAIVDTLRLPFLLQEFDPVSERTTVRILTRMSYFENIDGLSKDTIRHVLENEIMRNKLERMDDSDKEMVLIREALIEENKRAQTELAESRKKETEFIKHVGELEGLSVEDKGTISHLMSEVSGKKAENTILLERIKALRDDLDSTEKEKKQTAQRGLFITYFVKWPCMGIVAFAAILFVIFGATWSELSIVSLPLLRFLWLGYIWYVG